MISNLKSHTLNSLGAICRASELCEFASSLSSGDLALCGELCVSGYENLGNKFEEDLKLNLINSLKPGAYLGFSHHSNGYNEFVLLSSNGVEFSQNKHKLFKLNGEDRIFKAGVADEIKIHSIAGVNIGVLICFELRFIELWNRLKGADIILVPAMWGESRSEHYEVLSQALALQNRCFVIACSDMDLKFNMVFCPNGSRAKNKKFDINLINNFRQWMDNE